MGPRVKLFGSRAAFYLLVTWTLTLLWGEAGMFWWPHFACTWPTTAALPRAQTIPIAVITDPQLTDRTSYGMPRGSLVLGLTEFYSDLYMRRAFRDVVLASKPQAIFNLGDLFDGAPRQWGADWDAELQRYRWIFDGGHLHRPHGVPTHVLVGNHDIGYSHHMSADHRVPERFAATWRTELNYVRRYGAVDFVAVNSIALDGDRADSLVDDTWRFVEALEANASSAPPRILLTHVPLLNRRMSCAGAPRTSPVLGDRVRTSPGGRSLTYQNYLSANASAALLALRPLHVFSGHDHDCCHVDHALPAGIGNRAGQGRGGGLRVAGGEGTGGGGLGRGGGGVQRQGSIPENTIATFSWLQGNYYPSFMLLSVAKDAPAAGTSPDEVYAMQHCALPNQMYTYFWYAALFAVTVAALVLGPTAALVWEWLKYASCRHKRDDDQPGANKLSHSRSGLFSRILSLQERGAVRGRDLPRSSSEKHVTGYDAGHQLVAPAVHMVCGHRANVLLQSRYTPFLSVLVIELGLYACLIARDVVW